MSLLFSPLFSFRFALIKPYWLTGRKTSNYLLSFRLHLFANLHFTIDYWSRLPHFLTVTVLFPHCYCIISSLLLYHSICFFLFPALKPFLPLSSSHLFHCAALCFMTCQFSPLCSSSFVFYDLSVFTFMFFQLSRLLTVQLCVL